MTKGVKRAGVVLGLVWESVRFAVSSLRTDKFRTTLSLFGVTVGIFSIVLVLSIVDGLKKQYPPGDGFPRREHHYSAEGAVGSL